MDAHGRSFLDGRSWTLIFGWTLMDAHFWMDAHGRSFLDGRSWTLIFGWTLMDAHGRSWTLMDDRGRSWTIVDAYGIWLRDGNALVTRRSFDGHATVTVTLPNHKKYCIKFIKIRNRFNFLFFAKSLKTDLKNHVYNVIM
jgi:hypothetical protein